MPLATDEDHIANKPEYIVAISGLVQGVGFRPFIARLADELKLVGWVRNDTRGVTLRIRCKPDVLELFIRRISADKPPASVIHGLKSKIISREDTCEPVLKKEKFIIIESDHQGTEPTAAVTPDLGICKDCRNELLDPGNRRYRYALINCTNCGPRYSIIHSLPYDRPRTTMSKFPMCEICKSEYDDILDRRYHAQPIACPECGPTVQLLDAGGDILATGEDSFTQTITALENGKIAAIKGLGGFHLFTDATSEESVTLLRQRKSRDEKPLAVMFPSLQSIHEHADISNEEIELIESYRAPIVLLKRKKESHLADSLAPGNPWIGAMLPYTPVHVILMRGLKRPMVATSANLSEEPICTDNNEAVERMQGIADIYLVHDRCIARPVEDSLVRANKTGPMILRRARGYAPAPLILPDNCVVDLPILSVGGHLKNTIAVSIGTKVIPSPHIGDLTNALAVRNFSNTIDLLCGLYGGQPDRIVCDLHPDYASTQYAEESGLPLMRVQHHLAHILSCLLEHKGGPQQVLGVAWDGTGYGNDGTIWGGEFILVDKTRNCAKRVARMKPFRLPGGESAAKETLRCLIGALSASGLDESTAGKQILQNSGRVQSQVQLMQQAIDKGINAPVTSSAGRLFDAVASILKLSSNNSFEGKSGIAVECAATMHQRIGDVLPWEMYPDPSQSILQIDWGPMIDALCNGSLKRQDPGKLAMDFHQTLADMISGVARHFQIENVVLTGGCFQNALLTQLTHQSLTENQFEVLLHRELSANDNSIAAGQALAAVWGMFMEE